MHSVSKPVGKSATRRRRARGWLWRSFYNLFSTLGRIANPFSMTFSARGIRGVFEWMMTLLVLVLVSGWMQQQIGLRAFAMENWGAGETALKGLVANIFNQQYVFLAEFVIVLLRFAALAGLVMLATLWMVNLHNFSNAVVLATLAASMGEVLVSFAAISLTFSIPVTTTALLITSDFAVFSLLMAALAFQLGYLRYGINPERARMFLQRMAAFRGGMSNMSEEADDDDDADDWEDEN